VLFCATATVGAANAPATAIASIFLFIEMPPSV
jgi:hypothetical protein